MLLKRDFFQLIFSLFCTSIQIAMVSKSGNFEIKISSTFEEISMSLSISSSASWDETLTENNISHCTVSTVWYNYNDWCVWDLMCPVDCGRLTLCARRNTCAVFQTTWCFSREKNDSPQVSRGLNRGVTSPSPKSGNSPIVLISDYSFFSPPKHSQQLFLAKIFDLMKFDVVTHAFWEYTKVEPVEQMNCNS